jgi:hypothetical protein
MSRPISKILKNIFIYDPNNIEIFKICFSEQRDLKKIKLVIILDYQHIPSSLKKIINIDSTLLLFTSFSSNEKNKLLWRSFVIMVILYMKELHLNLVFLFVDNSEILNENIIKKDKNFLMLEVLDINLIHDKFGEINAHLGMHAF